MDEVTTDPLEPLRKQWEIEKSPTLSLQLAEEYGRRDDFLSAITVLRTGLTKHPRHIASKVLLARYLVELEQWPEAREMLERVAAVDPTHLIANKLLVKTHLATGDLAEARNRLDLYTLLNESDPDIEGLEAALGEREPTASSDAAEKIGIESDIEVEVEIKELPVSSDPAMAEADDQIVETEALPVEVETSVAEEVSLPVEAEELPQAAETPLAAEESPLGGIGGIGGRHVGLALDSSAATEDTGVTFEASFAEPEEAEEPEEVEDPPGSDRRPPPTPPATPADTTMAPPPRAAAANEPFGNLFGVAARERSRERSHEGLVDTAPASDIFALAQRVAEPAFAEPEPAAQPAPISGGEPEDAPPATVSLGQLYLQQGHAADAERTFAAVLEREPENAAARVGLAAVRGGGGWALSALDLVSREALTWGPRERKRALLSGYLDRLRAGGPTAG